MFRLDFHLYIFYDKRRLDFYEIKLFRFHISLCDNYLYIIITTVCSYDYVNNWFIDIMLLKCYKFFQIFLNFKCILKKKITSEAVSDS